jgi:hypothetical protein
VGNLLIDCPDCRRRRGGAQGGGQAHRGDPGIDFRIDPRVGDNVLAFSENVLAFAENVLAFAENVLAFAENVLAGLPGLQRAGQEVLQVRFPPPTY